MQEGTSEALSREIIEADMRRLAAEVKRYQEAPEHRGVSDEELMKRALQAAAALPPSEDAATSQSTSGTALSYLKNESAGTKLEVEYLLDVAFQKGVEDAVGMAKKASPFILDAFHDALVQKLYPAMKEKGYL